MHTMTRFGCRGHLSPIRVALPVLTIVSALLLQAAAARPSAAEPGLESMADTYVRALLEGDGPTVRRLTPSLGGETKINLTARVIFYYALPKTLDGTLCAMREQGQWKIRATELTL